MKFFPNVDGRFGGSGHLVDGQSLASLKNLPVREVELRAGYTIAWMQHHFRARGILMTHSGTLPACCPPLESNPIAK
jgi:hypothetical protein